MALTLEESKKIMDSEGWDILPSDGKLRLLGYKKLSTAIQRYHGGTNAFREKLREYMGQPVEDEKLEEMLEAYASDN